jgi:uncharacterized protein
LISLAVLFVLAVVAAYVFQRHLIYFPTPLADSYAPEAVLRASLVRFRAPEGPLVSGLFSPPPDGDRPVALVFHGNAGNLDTWSDVLRIWQRQRCGVLLVDPRGYGVSEGSPSEEGLHADAEAAMAFLAASGVAPQRVVVHGISIGSGMAVPLAAAHAVRALVLDSPFTSLADVASKEYPWLPVRVLLRDRFDNVAAAAGVHCPVLILGGECDEIVPPAHFQHLASAFPTRATVHVLSHCGHNDLRMDSDYFGALSVFVDSLPGARK